MPPHVNDSKWVSVRYRFSFVALFSGAISTLLAVALAVYIGLSGSADIAEYLLKEFIGYLLKVFAVIEILIVVLLSLFMLITAAIRSIGSKRNTFRQSWRELFQSVEQVWFYIPITVALLVYLIFGGI